MPACLLERVKSVRWGACFRGDSPGEGRAPSLETSTGYPANTRLRATRQEQRYGVFSFWTSVTQRCDASGFDRREGRHLCDVTSPLRGRLSVSSPSRQDLAMTPEVQLHIGIICGNCLKRGGPGPSPHSRIRKSGLGPQQFPGGPLHTPRSQCPQVVCALSPAETAHPAPNPSTGSDKAH